MSTYVAVLYAGETPAMITESSSVPADLATRYASDKYRCDIVPCDDVKKLQKSLQKTLASGGYRA